MAMRSSTGAALLLLSFIPILSTLVVPSTALGFNCSSNGITTCKALIDYVSPNTTTIAHIFSHFGFIDFFDSVWANPFAFANYSSQFKTVKIPFPCSCSRGTGISNRVPLYTVQQGDNLDHIAKNVYSGLVTDQEIARVNGITNPSNFIEIGQRLWIPLPCSCDEVNGNHVIHYGHVVPEGSSVDEIAKEFGIDKNTLLKLNGMSDPNERVQAGQLLDVPLKLLDCAPLVSKDADDYILIVLPKNGTYPMTAQMLERPKWDMPDRTEQKFQLPKRQPAVFKQLDVAQ